MIGFQFSEYTAQDQQQSMFDKLMDIFKQLLVYTSGDVSETLEWLNQLDREYNLTSDEYGIGDFIEDLKNQGFLEENSQDGSMEVTSKGEQSIRQSSLEEIFGKMKNTPRGDHRSFLSGRGDETTTDRREFRFGDTPDQIAMTESLRNAQINHGIDGFRLTEGDLEIKENEHKLQTSTVLMIDISHSMILYGEDRITPAKKVALGLTELITTRYPKDTLDVVVFGNDAWQVELKDLLYLQVGPYYTNTVAGLELAMDLLRKKKNTNKQIFMITDGKPTCLKEGTKYYKNSFGLDRKVINKTLNLATQCRRLQIPITTFMVAQDT
jgi:uncharacterized protein with von Willebrand factor type A (vWA) domain